MTIDDRFLIITGLSGSGKTIVSRFLEDMGYYCIDNLPTRMIPLFVDLWKRREFEIQKVALVVDIRERGFLTSFPEVWNIIRKKATPRLIFLDASDESLVKRFSETRRPHPLAPNKPALQGVRLERKRLAPIKAMADEVIDTSSSSIHQLRELFGRRLHKRKRHLLHVQVRSFGYKYGIPIDADLVFDTRFLPNPFYRDELKNRPGTNRRVRDFVLKQPETRAFLAEFERFLQFLMPRFIAEGKNQLVIAIGCTGGRHRSVVIADALADSLRGPEYDIKVFHRDVDK